MTLEDILAYCQQFPEVEETFPFDETTLVIKVAGKLFALIDIESPDSINLKCDPERALELRDLYAEVLPGYHMNKQHWNTVLLNGRLPNSLIKSMISHSYEMVVKGLPKAARTTISTLDYPGKHTTL
jgi:predicted DNA-binding protein (MmcQ/YjbR family)